MEGVHRGDAISILVAQRLEHYDVKSSVPSRGIDTLLYALNGGATSIRARTPQVGAMVTSRVNDFVEDDLAIEALQGHLDRTGTRWSANVHGAGLPDRIQDHPRLIYSASSTGTPLPPVVTTSWEAKVCVNQKPSDFVAHQQEYGKNDNCATNYPCVFLASNTTQLGCGGGRPSLVAPHLGHRMSGVGPVGVGIVGAGVISDQYLSNIVTFPDLRPLFVADTNLKRAAAQAEKYGIPGSGSVEELLAHPDIEIVVNLTIPAAHTEIATRAVKAGKSVWTEKPFALDRESGMTLLAEARAADLRVACAPDTVLGAGLQSALRLIESGTIGVPLTGLTLFQYVGPDSWHPNPEFLFAVGGGPLFDVGPYYLTTLIQIFGPVAKVTATASTARATRVIGSGPRAGTVFPVEVPTHFSALIQFESGQSAVSVFSFESGLTRAGVVEIAGTDGTAVLPDPNVFDGDTVVWRGMDSSESFAPVGASFGRGTGVVELAQAIRAGRPERASGELGYHVLDVMVSIAESAERDEPIAVVSTVVMPPALPATWDPRVATL